jgi:hypothetical protein
MKVEAKATRYSEGVPTNAVENLPPHKTRDIIAQTIGLGSGRSWEPCDSAWAQYKAAYSTDPLTRREIENTKEGGKRCQHSNLA